MIYAEEDFLPLSGLQHFAFCRRQWALIHIEQQWRENLRTVEGALFHTRTHDASQRERRGDTLILRDLPVWSYALGLSGKCDVVEFHLTKQGISLHGESGLWCPFPVEYKRGAPKAHRADELQLCAQALCLEEMLCCAVAQGALFYGETRRRVAVPFDSDLRQQVQSMTEQMHHLYHRGHTPKVRPSRGCSACSLNELCLPALMKEKSAAAYLRRVMEVES